MPDGTGIAQAVVENVKNTAADQTKSVFQEVKSELSFASSSKSQTSQTNATPQDPQYQQMQALDEQKKKAGLERIRRELHQKAQMLGVSQPTPPQKDQQEELEKENKQRQKEKEKQFETIAIPGSKNSHTDLGPVQSNSNIKAETGRGFKG